MTKNSCRALIVGGYGMFGRRLTHDLADNHGVDLLIAGRDIGKARMLQNEIAEQCGRTIGIVELDLFAPGLADTLGALDVDCVVNASGPFQTQDYRLAEACIAASVHYFDLADHREFVANIGKLHAYALKQDLLVVAGASAVPGLSNAVIDHFRHEFDHLESVHIGISPGNQTRRGIGTIQSVLECIGKPFDALLNGKRHTLFGWQQPTRHDFGPPLGNRWMADWDGPDHAVLPLRYPELKTVRFQAGLELGLLHLGLWSLSGLTRIGWVENWARHARLLKHISEWFFSWGSSSGGMFVTMAGTDKQGRALEIVWEIVAEHDAGPDIPTIAAELLVTKLLARELSARGAFACADLFTLDEFMSVVQRSAIYQQVRRSYDGHAGQPDPAT